MMTQCIFDAWCTDPRPLLFSEFLAEVDGWLNLPELILKELEWQREPPTVPFERELSAVRQECRRRSTLGDLFIVCLIRVSRVDGYTLEEAEAITSLLSRTLSNECPPDGLIAHVSDREFILMLSKWEQLHVDEDEGAPSNPTWVSRITRVCDSFDRFVPEYLQDDPVSLPAKQVPKLSIGVVGNEYRPFRHFSQIIELANEMVRYAETQPGSVFVVDRRQEA